MYALKLNRHGSKHHGLFVHIYFRTYVSLRIATRFKTREEAEKERGIDEQIVKIDLQWVELE